MKPFTVLLLYPAHMSVDGTETYLAHVTAAHTNHAIALAQREACEGSSSCRNSDEFTPLFVTEGHHNDLNTQQTGGRYGTTPSA